MQEIIYPPYSVLMSVYVKEKPEFLKQAIDSMLNQTVKPDEIVLVEDGPLTDELYEVLNDYSDRYPDILHRVVNETNLGLGKALNRGLEVCKNELVARMDTDDISVLDRCEKQLKYLHENAHIDVVGGNITEFIDAKENVVSVRKVPCSDEEIKKFLKKRCPMNHMSVMFKKDSVLNSGNYLDWHYNEDYYLWIRMCLNGCQFANIDENLVFVRVGADMYARRGGYKYYQSERKLFKFMRVNNLISIFAYFKAKIIRFILYVVMPNKLRAWAYKKFARQVER